MRAETLSAPSSVVAYFFARVKKELALTEMFCIKKEKAELHNHWRNTQGFGGAFLFLILLYFLIATCFNILEFIIQCCVLPVLFADFTEA